MNNRDFAIWLATHGHTQRSLAEKLGLTEQTISTYKRNNNFPQWFKLALKGLEK